MFFDKLIIMAQNYTNRKINKSVYTLVLLGGIMKKVILLSLIFILVVSASAELQIDAQKTQNSIYLDEQATYSLTIKNTDAFSKVIQVYSTDVKWYTELDPFVTRIGPGETLDLELKLIPNVWVEPGSQAVNVYVEAPTNDERISMLLPVYVKSYDQGEKQYNPSVEMKVSFPSSIDPREEVEITVYLRNRNRLNIENMHLRMDSNIISEERFLSLEPQSERKEIIKLSLDPLTKPQEDYLEVNIIVNNRSVNKERISYKVLPYSEFAYTSDTVEELFKKTTEYDIINEGNVKKEDYFSIPTTFIKKLFTTSSLKIDKFSLKKESAILWKLSLEPREEMKLIVVENYRPLIYLILISVVVTMIYFIYRSPVTIKKEAIVMGASSEGISDMKVLLHVRNRSQDLIEHIKVTDLIPSIAQLMREANIGTLAPTKILRNDKKGTIIKWELDALEPFEERIISYRLTSNIAIVGGLSLPPSKIKFEVKGGKERTVKSNTASVSIGI